MTTDPEMGTPVDTPRVASAPDTECTVELLRASADHPLVRSFPAGALLVFDHDLRYLCAGGPALSQVGLSSASMEGRSIFEVFDVEVVALIEPAYRLALDGAESVIDVPYDGHIYSQRLAPIRDQAGDVVAGMGYTQDVTRARRHESALRESEERNRLAFDHAPIGCAIASPDGRFTHVNRALCEMTGSSEAELCQTTVSQITFSADRADDETARSRLLAGEVVSTSMEKRLLTSSRATVWVTQSESLLRSDDGSPSQLVIQVQDISAKKHDEASLDAERRQLREAEIVGRLGSWQMEVATSQMAWSDGLFTLYGLDPRAFDGTLAAGMSCIHPDDRELVRSRVAVAATHGDPFTVRYRIRRADDGRLRWMDARGGGLFENGALARLAGTVTDVTELVTAANEAAAATALQQAVVTASPDVIFVLNAATRLIEWTNRPTYELLGYDITRRTWERLFADGALSNLDRQRFTDAVAQASSAVDDAVVTLEHEIRHADGSMRWLSHRITVLARDHDGTVEQLVGVTRDVTGSRRATEEAQQRAEHDELTRLPNRLHLTRRLATTIESCRREGSDLTVLFCDLDGFKRVNDTAGHAAGDYVLKETAARLMASVRAGDLVSRAGGDEFVIVLRPQTVDAAPGHGSPAMCSRQMAIDVGRRVVHALREPIWFRNVEHVLSVSIGIFSGPPPQHDATEDLTPEEQILQDADAAMYQAKRAGRDQFVVFESRMRADVVERGRVEQLLRRALRNSHAHESTDRVDPTAGAPMLYPAFQPIYDPATDHLVGFEALARLQDRDGRQVAPDCFIDVAESTGLISGLGREILRLSCLQMARWRTQVASLTAATMAVNVSGVQAQGDSLATDVRAALRESGLSPHDLILELTETSLLQASTLTINGLKRLRDQGVGIAIDDFGTGYASLRYLATLPVSILKIDRSFTAGLPHDETSRKIVTAVAGLAADLGLGCVVEGVETRVQQDSLPPGVHVQGWLHGRPQPAARLDIAALTGDRTSASDPAR